MNSLVSVCIPTYNGEKYILEALKSVDIQTYKNIELIISDDNSTDNTLKIVEEFKRNSKLPISIFHHNPTGIAKNWNNCIKKSRGEYVKFLFQDDILFPECIEKMVKAISRSKKIGLIACKREIRIETNCDKIFAENWLQNFGDLQVGIEPDVHELILNKDFLKSKAFLTPPLNKIGEPSLYLFRKSVVSEIGLFNNKYKQLLDLEFCLRILKTYEIIILTEKLVSFRLHGLQATQINNRKNDETKVFKKMLLRKYFSYLSTQSKKELFFDFQPLGKILLRLHRKFRSPKN